MYRTGGGHRGAESPPARSSATRPRHRRSHAPARFLPSLTGERRCRASGGVVRHDRIDGPDDYDRLRQKSASCERRRASTTARSILCATRRRTPAPTHRPFASAGHAAAKSFLRGVTRRFRDLNFAFLEVAWAGPACSTRTSSATGEAQPPRHWRRSEPVQSGQWRPSSVRGEIRARDAARGGAARRGLEAIELHLRPAASTTRRRLPPQDDPPGGNPRAVVPRFYFGCEADDPVNAWASTANANPMKAGSTRCSARHRPLRRPDIEDVVPEATSWSSTG